MAIPIAEQTVMPDKTQATTPEELHPVAAAFGGDIGAALQQGGEQIASRIETLSFHMARMNYYRSEAQRADLLNQYKTSLQTKLYGDPNNPNATVTSIGGNVMPPTGELSLSAGPSPSNVTPTTAPVEIPAGVYQRQGYAAAGALQDVDQWHQQAAQQILQQSRGLGLRNNAVLKTQMDNAWSSERMGIVQHEAKQIDEAQQQTYFKGLQLDADNAVTKQDPVSLGRVIDSINDQNKTLNDSQGKDPNDPIRELTANKFVGQALNNSMTANLKINGGSPNQFQATLDKLHDDGKISDTVYDNAQEHLDRVSKQIITQNEIQAKTQTVNEQASILNSAIQGKLDFKNPNTLSEISAKYPKLGEALDHYNNNKGAPIDDKDDDFSDATQKIFSAGSKEQIMDYMTNVLKEKNISQDRINILAGAALDRGKGLPDLDGQSKAPNPIQNLYDAGMKVLFGTNANEAHPNMDTLVDYMKTVKEGKTVPEAIQHAQGQDALRENPHLLNIPANGQVFRDKYGNQRIVYPDLHTEAIGGQKPTSGEKESNGNSND